MFEWLFRYSPLKPFPANYDRIRELFVQRFATGGFSSCDMRPQFECFGHSAWCEIAPAETIEATRALAYCRLTEMVDFLRTLQPSFGPHDRIGFAVGFPVAVKAANRRMFKGWFPAARLGEVRPPNFTSVGGAFGENEIWFEGLGLARAGPTVG